MLIPTAILPASCRNCSAELDASLSILTDGCCPNCQLPVCFYCGCVPHLGCRRETFTLDGRNSSVLTCSWTEEPGLCDFCFWRMAYVAYMTATGRAADDTYYVGDYGPGGSVSGASRIFTP